VEPSGCSGAEGSLAPLLIKFVRVALRANRLSGSLHGLARKPPQAQMPQSGPFCSPPVSGWESPQGGRFRRPLVSAYRDGRSPFGDLINLSLHHSMGVRSRQ